MARKFPEDWQEVSDASSDGQSRNDCRITIGPQSRHDGALRAQWEADGAATQYLTSTHIERKMVPCLTNDGVPAEFIGPRVRNRVSRGVIWHGFQFESFSG